MVVALSVAKLSGRLNGTSAPVRFAIAAIFLTGSPPLANIRSCWVSFLARKEAFSVSVNNLKSRLEFKTVRSDCVDRNVVKFSIVNMQMQQEQQAINALTHNMVILQQNFL